MPVTIRTLSAALACACALLAAGPARAWNAGTHLLVAEKLARQQGLDPRLVMAAEYGANALDLFNNDFSPLSQDLAAWLHDPSGDLFMKAWQAARLPALRAYAFGLVSHNDAWGVDFTAHVSGLTSGQGVGWVIEKAEMLGAALDPVLQANGIFLTPAQLVDVGHILVEQAVDLLLLQDHPALGVKLLASAALRDPRDPALLALAWSEPFAGAVGSRLAAARTIWSHEAELREFLMSYGWALTRPDVLELVAGQIGVMAEGYLGLPPGSGQALVPLVVYGIQGAMQLCAPDYQQEVDATAAWVGANMAAAGVAF